MFCLYSHSENTESKSQPSFVFSQVKPRCFFSTAKSISYFNINWKKNTFWLLKVVSCAMTLLCWTGNEAIDLMAHMLWSLQSVYCPLNTLKWSEHMSYQVYSLIPSPAFHLSIALQGGDPGRRVVQLLPCKLSPDLMASSFPQTHTIV